MPRNSNPSKRTNEAEDERWWRGTHLTEARRLRYIADRDRGSIYASLHGSDLELGYVGAGQACDFNQNRNAIAPSKNKVTITDAFTKKESTNAAMSRAIRTAPITAR